MATPSVESEYDFTLLLDGSREITDDIERALDEAGCDDATLSQRSGRLHLTFSRLAPSMKDAIVSALLDVVKAGVGLTVIRVDDCSLVTQAEIARHIGRTRQLVNQYINGQRGPGGFPAPACNITEASPLWYWCEVAHWLFENNLIKEQQLRDAQELSTINTALELLHQRRVAPELTSEIQGRLLGGEACCPP